MDGAFVVVQQGTGLRRQAEAPPYVGHRHVGAAADEPEQATRLEPARLFVDRRLGIQADRSVFHQGPLSPLASTGAATTPSSTIASPLGRRRIDAGGEGGPELAGVPFGGADVRTDQRGPGRAPQRTVTVPAISASPPAASGK